jgi:rfaE bifunctional protein nucleotidyltransferase chain/domain
VALLESARGEGDVLIVGLNSDASVRRLGKGEDRPVVAERNRARVLAGGGGGGWGGGVGGGTPRARVSRLKPDVLVKGADYAPDAIVGAADVEGWGGRVVRVPLVKDTSTTNLLRKLRGA